MAVFKGKAAQLAIVAAKVGEMDKVQWSSKLDLADKTQFGDTGKTFDAQLAGFTITADGRLDPGDAQQAALITGHTAGTLVTSVRMYISATHYYQGDAYVDSFDASIAPDALATAHFGLTGNGVWTYV